MREAMLYEKQDDRRVRCNLCAHRCVIAEGHKGKCSVRKNVDGVLYSLTYDRVTSMAVDPIEKKPLFHVRPGSESFSLATVGCNFSCTFCQNHDLSQWAKEQGSDALPGRAVSPAQLVSMAQQEGCASIAFTYSEPTIFFELAYDTAQLAVKQDIATIFVTNGFMTPEALDTIAPCLTAANVDLKSFNDKWYRSVAGGRLQPVLDTIAGMKERGIFVEVTTLVIPGENDSNEELRSIAEFLASVDPLIPWHISAFRPMYHMQDKPSTSMAAIDRAYAIGEAAGLKYIYPGNIFGDPRESTRCHSCGHTVLRRQGYRITDISLKGAACSACGASVPLVL